MAFLTLSLTEAGQWVVHNAQAKTPQGTYVAQIHLEHEYDFGNNISVEISAQKSTGGVNDYKGALIERIKGAQSGSNASQNTAALQMAEIKSMILSLKIYDRTDGHVLTRLRGRLHEGGGFEDLEENWGNNPSFASTHLDYYTVLGSTPFKRVDTWLNVTNLYSLSPSAAKPHTAILSFMRNNGFDRGYASSKKGVVLNVPNAVMPTDKSFGGNGADNAAKWQQMLKEVSPNYVGLVGADDMNAVNALTSVNQRTGGHLFIDVGNMTSVDAVVALSAVLSQDNHQMRLMWNPTIARPSDGSSIRKAWRPCVGDYIAKHITRNQLRDANGIPPLHVPVGGYDFPLGFLGTQYFDGFFLSDEDQENLAAAHVIMVVNERFNRESRWIYGDVLTQRNSKTSALRLANAAEIETFTARGVIEIAKRYLLSGMSDYLSKSYSDCARFLDNCVAAGLLEPAEQLGGLYYSLDIQPRADKPFEAVDIKLSRRVTGAVRQAYLETTINK